MNDDVDGAEDGLKKGNSSFHKVLSPSLPKDGFFAHAAAHCLSRHSIHNG